MEIKDKDIQISKSAFKTWLEQLQQESWQLELLISGFALLGIWEVRGLIDSFDAFRELQAGGLSKDMKIFYSLFDSLLTTGWRIFFFNLLIHIVARGLWIGAIGLRYVSGEINYNSLNYAPIFEQFLERRVGDFDDYIQRLERFSSVIFAYTFLLFFIFLSLILYWIECSLVFSVSRFNMGLGGISILIFLGMGLLVFLDFITIGGIKRIKDKSFARGYFVFYRVFSILTLSFLYRPLLYNFWDEKYTRRLFFFSIPYIFLLGFIPNFGSDATPFFPIHGHGNMHERGISETISFSSEYYDDERLLAAENAVGIFNKPPIIRGISLPSIELYKEYAWVFLRSYPSDNKWLEREKQIIPYKKTGFRHRNTYRDDPLLDSLKEAQNEAVSKLNQSRRKVREKLRANEISAVQTGVLMKDGELAIDRAYWRQKVDSIESVWGQKIEQFKGRKLESIHDAILQLARIHIDGVPFNDSCSCKFYIHPNAGERGLRCYFPTNSLTVGEHLIHLERTFYDEEMSPTGKVMYERDTINYYVPFYKQ